MARGRLGFFWGNKVWGQRPSGELYVKEALKRSSPNWIDYRTLPGGSTESLLLEAYAFREQRIRLHNQIIEQCIRESGATKVEKPACIITSGGTASGKTSVMDFFVNEVLQEFAEEKFIRIDFDRIKRLLPEYEHMTGLKIKEAAPYTQSESAKISGKYFKRAIKEGTNIIFETTLGNPTTLEERIREMKRKGYVVYIVGTHLKEPEGQARAITRFNRGGRYVPPEAIKATYQGCPVSLKQLADKVDILILFDNNGSRPLPMFVRQKAPELNQVLDGTAYAAYLQEVGNNNDLTK